MHTGRKYQLKELLFWTRREIFIFILIAAIPTVLYEVLGLKSLSVPWLPIAVIGTAVAFLVGFKNNATYDRMWEARKIWGAVVNSSRTWGIMVCDYVSNLHATESATDEELNSIKKRLIYRHLAWLTALRYQLRKPKSWESMHKAYAREFRKRYQVPEFQGNLEEQLRPILSEDELKGVLGKKNRATQLVALQSTDLKKLRFRGLIDDFRHMEMQGVLQLLYDHQGKSERIKNFPYPRQFTTINLYFVWIFVLLVPFGMLEEFDKMGDNFTWLTIPFSVLVAWIFHTMDKIGEATAYPFEGGANDIPMNNLSRTIEIDLREMLEETEVPEATQPINNILM